MIRWVTVVVAILWYCSLGACSDVDAGSIVPQLLSNDSRTLSELIEDFVRTSHSDNCSANLVNGGFIVLKNKTWPSARNFTVNNPNLFVSCKNSAGSLTDYSAMLEKFAETISSLQVIDDSEYYLEKDDFKDSILMIAFTSCAICVGTWMLYMVLLFQRCPQHAGRRLLILCYVLFAGIYESINLNRTVQTIFKKQYSGNYQDSVEYETIITNSNSHRAGELITDFLAALNWISIIYYMYHNCKRIEKRWLPRVIGNRNRLIIGVGLCLTIVQESLFGILLWCHWNNGVRIAHFIFELFTYALFCGLIFYFVYHDFGFTLSLKRRHRDQRARAKQTWKDLWRDYHEILPLLAYNLVLLAFLFFMRIYLFANIGSTKKWKFTVIKFFKIAITVSIWGLITGLEKRELIVSRETVLGRKIQNADRFFYDPGLTKDDDVVTSGDESPSAWITPQSSEACSSNCMSGETKVSPWAAVKLQLPIKAWKSQLASAKNRRRGITRRRRRLLHALAGSNKRKQENEHYSDSLRSAVPSSDQVTNRDDTSVETELATNYLYDIYDS
ncbi:DFG16 (YOR030W) [Zygosaccharomyces parabailii]|nr:DFG16 (YOR030W) [Zygosaccharomyces parabailii]CDH10388.1 uncharacterized protein ZBAI_02172 [Zygosaccharomyces bailii ISA1307]